MLYSISSESLLFGLGLSLNNVLKQIILTLNGSLVMLSLFFLMSFYFAKILFQSLVFLYHILTADLTTHLHCYCFIIIIVCCINV